VIIPHDDKRHRGGEDAAASNQSVIVVADGVGGWAEMGIDPGIFSKELTRSALEIHEKDYTLDAIEILARGCDYASSQF